MVEWRSTWNILHLGDTHYRHRQQNNPLVLLAAASSWIVVKLLVRIVGESGY